MRIYGAGWRQRWLALTYQERIEGSLGFLRRWSWAFAIPLSLFAVGTVGLVITPPLRGLKLVTSTLICYGFFWALLWGIGKTGTKDFNKMLFPQELGSADRELRGQEESECRQHHGDERTSEGNGPTL